MSEIIINICFGFILFALLIIGIMVNQISKDMAEIYGALFVQGKLDECKRGEWKHYKGSWGYKCTVCRFPILNDKLTERYNFCPNCGADMRGENDADR